MGWSRVPYLALRAALDEVATLRLRESTAELLHGPGPTGRSGGGEAHVQQAAEAVRRVDGRGEDEHEAGVGQGRMRQQVQQHERLLLGAAAHAELGQALGRAELAAAAGNGRGPLLAVVLCPRSYARDAEVARVPATHFMLRLTAFE